MIRSIADSINTVRENDKYVKEVVKNLTAEAYNEDRLIKLIAKSNQYENLHGGSRANRIVIKAAEFRLTELKQLSINYGTNL
jgi:hypothetical protein